MEQRILDLKLQMETLISEREGMIAENMQRQHLGQSMAYVEDSFQINAGNMARLIEVLWSLNKEEVYK